MNYGLLNSLDKLLEMHTGLESLQAKQKACEKKKETAVFPTPDDYFKQNVRLPQPPVEPVMPQNTGLTPEEYANRAGYIDNYVRQKVPDSEKPVGKMFLFLVLALLGLLSYMDAQYWNVLNDIFFLGIIFSILELGLVIVGIPAGVIGFIVEAIACMRCSSSDAQKRKALEAEASNEYARKRAAYEQYQYAMQAYVQNKAIYERNLQTYKNWVAKLKADSRAEYQRRLPELRVGFDRMLRQNDAEIARLGQEITEQTVSIRLAGDSIGLVSQYALDRAYVAALKRLVAEGRADSVKEAVNLHIHEEREKSRLEYARQQAANAERAANYARQQAMYEQERAATAQRQYEEQQEYNKQMLDAEERRREDDQRRWDEAQEAARDQARSRGRDECFHCRNHNRCLIKSSNCGGCASYIPE